MRQKGTFPYPADNRTNGGRRAGVPRQWSRQGAARTGSRVRYDPSAHRYDVAGTGMTARTHTGAPWVLQMADLRVVGHTGGLGVKRELPERDTLRRR